MPAYLLVIREGAVLDPVALADYGAATRASAAAFRERYGIKPLSIYGTIEALEGEAPDGVVLLEFPSAEAARAWYTSPEYQAAILLRQRAAPYRLILIDGLPTTTPPPEIP